MLYIFFFFFFQAEDGIRDLTVTGVQTCALPILYGIPKGGNECFIQITTDSVVWGGLSGATPAEAVSWGKVNPGVLPDTVVAYCDSTIAFPIFCEYAIGSPNGRRQRKELVRKRDALVANLTPEAK